MFLQCSQRSGWIEVEVPSNTDPDKVYTCLLPPWDRTTQEVSCECEGYLRRGRCSHQAVALALVCDWSEELGPALAVNQRTNGLCPLCGGLTEMVIE